MNNLNPNTPTVPKISSANIATALQTAMRHHRSGDLRQAAALYRGILNTQPKHADASHLLGVIALQAYEPQKALDLINKAISINPNNADYHLNKAMALKAQKQFDDAVRSFENALALKSNHVPALLNLAQALMAQGKLNAATERLRQVLKQQPQNPQALNTLGKVFYNQGRFSEAVDYHQQALKQKPDDFVTQVNLGNALLELGELEQAISHYQQAVEQQPESAEAHYNLANALAAAGQLEQAVNSHQQALKLNPDYPQIHNNLGDVLFRQGKLSEAAASFANALEKNPDYRDALDNLIDMQLRLCDWRQLDTIRARLLEPALAEEATTVAPPRPFLVTRLPLEISAAERQQLMRATTDRRTSAIQPLEPIQRKDSQQKPRLRLGYVSTDFNNHATSHLIYALFALHNREQFEVFAYSIGKDDGSFYRQTIERDCDTFRDVRTLSSRAIAEQIQQDQIDILIDLNGHSAVNRLEIFALRPASVQATYLAFPATTGAKFFDYLITDRIVTPPDQQEYFDETFAYLPHSYQINSPRKMSEETPSRAECDLPESGFVFCCFNNHFKIEPKIFDVWMNILRKVPDSVLWLLAGDAAAHDNLRQEAEQRDVDPQRLVFAERLSIAQHLARHRHADLFLDTYYYNAHTTASDALWMDVPVITCPGESFASRVGQSLVTAVGMPELAVADFAAYEEMAVRLAQSSNQLGALREKLEANRDSCALFDIERFAKSFEQILLQAWKNHQSGKLSKPISISAS